MAATAAKVAAQVAPDIVTGGIVAEAGPRPDFSHWTVEDDILLKNSVEAGAAMEALAKGAVRFTRRFSVKELRERWRALLYDPVVAKEAAARIVEAETALADSSRAKVPNKLKDTQELVRKRRLNSVRTKYYKMRKRIAADKLVSVDQKQDLQNMDAVQGASSQCESIEGPRGKELHSLDQVTHEDLALDLEDRTFSHMFSLLAAGGVGAVIGALPAVASAECPGNSSEADGVFLLPLGNGHPEFTVATNVISSTDHNENGLVGPEPSPCQALEGTEGLTENLVVRGVNNAEDTTTMAQEQDIVRGVEIAEDTTIMAIEQDIAVPGMPFSIQVQVSPANSPLHLSHLSDKVEDQNLVPEHALSGEAVQVHPVLCPLETVQISTEGEFRLSSAGTAPVQSTWFKSSEPLRNGIYVVGASFCSDGAEDADLIVDKQTESLCRQVQLPECETEKAANEGLHNELRRPESEHCDISEYFDRSLWPHQLVLCNGEDHVHVDGELYSGSGDDSSAFSDRQVDCAFDDLEPNESPSGMVERMWVESPPACATGAFVGTEALIQHESSEPTELTVPVPSICVLNTEDTDIPSLDGSLLSPSSSQSSFFLSQDEWESWSEGLTTDASEVSKCVDGNGFQSGAGDASDMGELNQGLLHGFLENCKMNEGGVPEAGVGTGLCSLLRSDADHAVAQSMCEELHADVVARQCQEFQTQQGPDEREVIGVQFGVVAPYNSELEAAYDVGVATFAPDTNATTSFVNSKVVGSGTDWQNGDLKFSRLPPQLECDQPVQDMKGNEVYEESNPAAHEHQELNSEDELSSDVDMARFSDVEAMILEMDLDPGFDDEFSARAESRRNYRRHSRTLIRLEQGASSAIQRSLTLHGAIAILYGYQARYFITKAEVLLGRATQDNVVDIDLTEEGRANKVSRRQAYIKLKEDGVFYLKNLGRRVLTVNNNAVQFNQRASLGSNCLIEVGGMRFIFEINHKLVKSRVPKLRPA